VPSPRTLVVGTRGSRLALRQTEIVVDALRAAHPHIEIAVREVRTEGDRRPEEPLANIGGRGVFVKGLERALLDREIDLAVHSAKDVPADVSPGLTLAAFPRRGDPRDALVTRNGATLAELAAGARVGTGSARRAVQLLAMRPDLQCLDIRGNVDTRIRKVNEGQYDAVVLAVAGLERLGLLDRASEIFEPDVMLPAVGQGALAVEVREDDAEVIEVLRALDDADTRAAVVAERAFLQRLGGGCRLPFGALAQVERGALRMRGFISDAAGLRMLRAEQSGPVEAPAALGRRLAEDLLAQGATEFVKGTSTPA
jgi:hydroxymethylbilane synthase